MDRTSSRTKNRKLIIISIFGAITAALGFTPLGFIPLGILNATTLHIPVIIGAIIEGPFVGAIVGLIFGLSSIMRSIMNASPLTPFIMNPLVSVLPRILIGLFAGYAYIWVKKLDEKLLKKLSYVAWTICSGFLGYVLYYNITSSGSTMTIVLSSIFLGLSLFMLYYTNKKMNSDFAVVASAFIGSMTNTIFFLGIMYILYAEQYMIAVGQPVELARQVIFGVAITSGIPEAILSVIVTTAVVKGVLLSSKR